jgi:hypothetical protein
VYKRSAPLRLFARTKPSPAFRSSSFLSWKKTSLSLGHNSFKTRKNFLLSLTHLASTQKKQKNPSLPLLCFNHSSPKTINSPSSLLFLSHPLFSCKNKKNRGREQQLSQRVALCAFGLCKQRKEQIKETRKELRDKRRF